MANDDEIWRGYAKGVKKIRKAKAAPSAKPVRSPSRLREGLGVGGEFTTARDLQHSQASPPCPPPSPPASGRGALTAQPTHLDRRIERGLRRGDIEIGARLDLHGMTQT